MPAFGRSNALEKTFLLQLTDIFCDLFSDLYPDPISDLEIPILLYRTRKGKWKIKNAGKHDQAKFDKNREEKILPKKGPLIPNFCS